MTDAISLTPYLLLFSHLCLCPQSDLFPLGFSTQTVCNSVSTFPATYFTHLIFLVLITRIITYNTHLALISFIIINFKVYNWNYMLLLCLLRNCMLLSCKKQQHCVGFTCMDVARLVAYGKRKLCSKPSSVCLS